MTTRRPTRTRLLPLLGVAALLAAAAPALGPGAGGDLEALRRRYARPREVPYPPDNAWSEPREALGRILFFDPRLSGSGVTACATCHNPGFSWGDGLERAVGHAMKPLPRRTPSVLNLAWAAALFWDGRAATLEEQALGPIASPDEMNLPLEELVPKLRAIPEYAPLFEAAYPGEGVSASTVARAIATFERTLVSGRAPFDAWVEGDEGAISAPAKRGFALFNGKARCDKCHDGWRFTDDGFHDIGVGGSDRGRGRIVEGIGSLEFAFKTPSLRNVDRRAPYMHDGSERTLGEVVELYDRGGRVKRESLSPEIVPLELTAAESADLVAFMRTLTSEDPAVAIPRLPR
jgi:cytochrome c peroxidase